MYDAPSPSPFELQRSRRLAEQTSPLAIEAMKIGRATLESLDEYDDADSLLDSLREELALFAEQKHLPFNLDELQYQVDTSQYHDEGTMRYTFFYENTPLLEGDIDERISLANGLELIPEGWRQLMVKLELAKQRRRVV